MTETYNTEDFVRAMQGATVSAYSPGAGTYCAASPARNEEFDRFEDTLARDPGREMTAEIESDPNEVARLRLSRQQAREGKVRWDPEGEDGSE